MQKSTKLKLKVQTEFCEFEQTVVLNDEAFTDMLDVFVRTLSNCSPLVLNDLYVI